MIVSFARWSAAEPCDSPAKRVALTSAALGILAVVTSASCNDAQSIPDPEGSCRSTPGFSGPSSCLSPAQGQRWSCQIDSYGYECQPKAAGLGGTVADD